MESKYIENKKILICLDLILEYGNKIANESIEDINIEANY